MTVLYQIQTIPVQKMYECRNESILTFIYMQQSISTVSLGLVGPRLTSLFQQIRLCLNVWAFRTLLWEKECPILTVKTRLILL